MTRIYIRSSEGKAVRGYKIGLASIPLQDGTKAQIRKQIWKPIGWLCLYCKKMYYDKGFWKKPD